MRVLRRLRLRFRSLVQRHDVDAELDRELTQHIEQLVNEGLADGLSEAESRRSAMRAFGPRALVTDQCHDTRRVAIVEDFAADTRYALRWLARAPGFAFTAVLSIALGVGVNTAIFGLVNTVLLRTLPVERPDELVFATTVGTNGVSAGAPPYPCFERFRNETTTFAGLAAFSSGDQLRVEVDGQVEQIFGQVVSGGYFDVLGLRPATGRLLTQADETRDAMVAVLGYSYWQRRFGGSSNVIGRTISFNGRQVTVVGVAPREFWGLIPGRQIEVTLPMWLDRERLADSGAWWFDVIGRLQPGATVAQAQAQTNTVFQSFMADRQAAGPGPRPFDHIEIQPASRGLNTLRTRFATPLYALVGAAAVVLALACVNLATLLLVRGASRTREFAIRRATGAAGGRLIRQLVTETLVLFVIGSAVGLVVADVMANTLIGFFSIGRSPILLDVRFDWPVVAFAGGLALLTGLTTGLWPAVRAWRSNAQDAMHEGHARVAGSRRSTVARRLLVASQVALSLVLLVIAMIFVKTMANLRSVDLGFSASRVLTMSLYPIFPTTDAAAARQRFWTTVLARVRAVPGVRSASLSVLTPLSGRDTGRQITVAGFDPPNNRDRMVHVNHVSDDYFRTFGMDLRAGRSFTGEDDGRSRKVAIVNESAARKYFGGRDPIGQTIGFGPTAVYEVVGIVRDHKHRSVREAAPPSAFVPVAQPLDALSRVTLSLSSDERFPALARTVADEVRAIDAATLATEVLDVQEQIDATLVSERLLSSLASSFAFLALGIAAVGLYGVLSSALATRRREFAVRMALGARPLDIAGGVFREVLIQMSIGAAIGLPVALLAARAAADLLFVVTPTDPGSYIASVVLLAGVAGIAAWLPARRAWTINPSEALRGD